MDEGVLVRIEVEDLPWMARLLAGLGVPFVIHHPPELRGVFRQYALTMISYAERTAKEERFPLSLE
jgi:predicted DNA-binding transcriptional regulator YafY